MTIWKSELHVDHAHQFLHRCCALVQSRLFVSSQLDLDDLLDPLGAQLHRYADVEAVDAILSVKVGGAGQNLLLVLQDRLDHLGDGRGRRGIGRSRLEIFHDLETGSAYYAPSAAVAEM